MRVATTVLLALTHAATVSPQEGRTLRSILADAESVAIVTVTARETLRVDADVAFDVVSCDVERVWFGPPRTRLFLVTSTPAAAASDPLQVGVRCLAFTARAKPRRQPRAAQARLDELTGDAVLQRIVHDPWPVTASGGELEVPGGAALPEDLPLTAGRTAIGPTAQWIARETGALAWSVDGLFVTNGPGFWSVRVQPDGRWTCGDESDRLAADAVSAWRRTIEQAASPEIPDDVGRSKGPDSPYLVLTLRTDRLLRRIRVHPTRDEDPPEVAEQRRRVLALWRALPGQGRPPLPGERNEDA